MPDSTTLRCNFLLIKQQIIALYHEALKWQQDIICLTQGSRKIPTSQQFERFNPDSVDICPNAFKDQHSTQMMNERFDIRGIESCSKAGYDKIVDLSMSNILSKVSHLNILWTDCCSFSHNKFFIS
jgi:hypothetical protein